MALFTPITSPLIFSRAPPALPGLVDTSVTIASGIEYDVPCVLTPPPFSSFNGRVLQVH